MLNIFNPTDHAPVSTQATETPKASEESSVEAVRLKWYETPLMFIGTITGLLVVIHFVERKVE